MGSRWLDLNPCPLSWLCPCLIKLGPALNHFASSSSSSTSRTQPALTIPLSTCSSQEPTIAVGQLLQLGLAYGSEVQSTVSPGRNSAGEVADRSTSRLAGSLKRKRHWAWLGHLERQRSPQRHTSSNRATPTPIRTHLLMPLPKHSNI